MVSVLGPSAPFFRGVLSLHSRHEILSSVSPRTMASLPIASLRAVRAQGIGNGAGDDSAVLRKPVVSSVVADEEVEEERSVEERTDKAEWVDWEDQILQETVPLVGFVRMILHSGKYEIGDRLSSDHEKTIVEKLLLYHPESEKKIGSGIKYIKVGLHPEFDASRCLFIVRNDGQTVDFSYWKCIKGLIRKKYPLHADSFILRHFRRRRSNY